MSTTVTLERVSVDVEGLGTPAPAGGDAPTRTRTRRAPRRRSGPVGVRHLQPAPVHACSLEGVRSTAAQPAQAARDAVRPGLGPIALTRRGRVLALVVLVVVACAALTMGVSAATTGSPSDVAVVYETVTVQPGQSLWSIARAAEPEADPRSTMARIVELNALDGVGGLAAGQQLTVPVTR